MIAKNVGIRRASGKFVLATNIDVIINQNLYQFISTKKLKEKLFTDVTVTAFNIIIQETLKIAILINLQILLIKNITL